MNGGTIQGYIDGQMYFSIWDTSLSSGRSGFLTLGGTNYDEVLITDLGGGTLFWDTSFRKAPGWWANSGGWYVENGESSNLNPNQGWETAYWSSGPTEGDTGGAYEVTGRQVGANNGAFALLFRYQDASNYYYVQLYQGKVQLFKKVGSSTTWLGEASFTWNADTNYTLRAHAQENDFRIYVNNTQYLRVFDSSLGPGRLGLGSWGGHHHFDNARVQSIAYAVSNVDLTWTDYRYQVKVKTTVQDSSPSIFFRWQDANNYYWAQMIGSGMRVGKVVGGVKTDLGSWGEGGPGRAPNQWYTMKVEVVGQVIRAYIDGIQYPELSDGSLASGKVGMNAWDPTYYDDVLVQDLRGAPVSYSYDGNGNMTSGGGRTISWDVENRVTQVAMESNATSFVYDADGKLVKKTGPANTFAEGFQSSNANWVYSAYQTVPFVENGQYAVRTSGTGVNWDANFYRSAYSITTGKEARVEFKVDGTDTGLHLALEDDSSPTYYRWAINAWSNRIYVQYTDGGGWVYPQDLINPVKVGTWYVAILRVDDSNGFRIEVRERDNPSVVGSYTRSMPTGRAWRFRHWIYRGNGYLTNYVERKFTGETIHYPSRLYEKNVTTAEVTKYYYAEGRRIAMRKGSNVYYLLSDHLGSTVSVVESSGGNPRESHYYSFGSSRLSPSSPSTDKLYTGQQLDSSLDTLAALV